MDIEMAHGHVTVAEVGIAIAVINIAWAAYYFHVQNREFFRREKINTYRELIFSAEEAREAYFEGKPEDDEEDDGTNLIWGKNGQGWLRNDGKPNSTRYVNASNQMNRALAGISLFASEKIAILCSDIENIATDYKGSKKRNKQMNELVTLMRKDIKVDKGNATVREETWD
jgi:hypothetical protein